jgi:uncharacterized protein
MPKLCMITLRRAIFKGFCLASAIFDSGFFYDNLHFTVIFMALVKCPQCGKQTEYEGNEFRPFCSERCKLLDFGAWADEEYTLPAETADLSDEDVDAIERALKEKQDL